MKIPTYNLQHRIQLCWQAYWRLSKVLRNRALSQASKVRIWQSCVYPVLTHSIAVTGVLPHSRALIHQLIHKQLSRQILKLPAHITKITSSEICQRAGIEDSGITHPALPPKQPCFPTSSQETWYDKPQDYAVSAVGIAAHSPTDPPPTTIQAKARLRPISSAMSYRPLACPVCGVEYTSLQTVRVHMAEAHQMAGASNPTDSSNLPAALRKHRPALCC